MFLNPVSYSAYTDLLSCTDDSDWSPCVALRYPIFQMCIRDRNTALSIDPKFSVLLICKKELSLSNSSLAQGGIAAVWDTSYDSTQQHFHDTFVAGGYQNDANAVAKLVHFGPQAIRQLISYGVDFDKTKDGKEHLTLEGGHSHPRICLLYTSRCV